MQAHVFNALILDYGHYQNGGEPMKRGDGSVVEYVVVFDPESRENLTLTLDSEVTLDKRPGKLTHVDLDCRLVVNRKAGHTGEGRAYVGNPAPKLTVVGMKPAAAVANGKPAREPVRVGGES